MQEPLFHLMGPLLFEKLFQSVLWREKGPEGQRPGFKPQLCRFVTLEGTSI